jgi:D-alanine-D-alanine ligase-like ATP-grasp enzyme
MAAIDPTAEPRPRLVVVYGHRSLDAMQIRAAARGWCDLVWLVDGADPSVAAIRPLLNRFGIVVDALRSSPADAARALRTHRPDGLATFYDTGMEHVAAIAAELDLPFHSPQVAIGLEDKLHQREALRAAGLPTPGVIALPAGAARASVQRLGSAIGYPAVLKPRKASGSWHTFPVANPMALGELWAQLAPEEPEAMVVEEYLSDGAPMPLGFEADYVSVETVVVAGRMTHLAITGRFPPAPPFRETGFFIPSSLGPEHRAQVLALAGRTLRALGVEHGAAHTEIKLTAEGLRVIEVNARVGGGVPEMLRLAAGIDIVKLTMGAALGWATGIGELPATSGVAYRFFYQPPESARRLTAIDGLDRLKALAGVESIYLHYPPGTEIDAAHGTRTYVFAVVGWASDHAGVKSVAEFLQTEIAAVYDHA